MSDLTPACMTPACNIGAIAPVLGITKGEIKAGPRKAGERWAIHVLQAVVTAVVAERLTDETAGVRSDIWTQTQL